MEDSPIVPPPIVPPIAPVQSPSFITRFSPKKGKSFLFLFVILGILALGGGMFTYNNSKESKEGEGGKSQEQIGQFISDNVIVYGYWVDDKAVVALHNLKNNTSGILTTLPTNVKHVKITSPTTLLYIAETDERDHGKTITQRNLETGEDTVVFKADTNFGIDDYAVSPNGRYISIWEVKMPESSAVLINGISRVVNLDRTTNQTYVIYDEIFGTSTPVHYPVGITDTGDLFTDRFIANSGAGWAYGMSKSNLTGTQKSDIPGMVNGTYSSQPAMSPDGRYIAFVGYSGTDGATEDEQGFRKIFENPDTIGLLNTATSEKKIVIPQKDNIKYFSVTWDTLSDNLFIAQANFQDGFTDSQIKYNPQINTSAEILSNSERETVYSSLNNGKYLLSVNEPDEAFMGNLSGKYAPSIKSLSAYSTTGNPLESVDLNKSPIQLISVKAETYFTEGLVKRALESIENDQLQIASLEIKLELAPKRKVQQSNPPPPVPTPTYEYVDYSKLPTWTPPTEDQYNGGCVQAGKNLCVENQECLENHKEKYLQTGECTDSPLYLYGEEGQKVSVQIGVPLYSPNIPYSPERGVDAEISSNGSFYANGKLIDGFSFDYTPGIKKIKRPEYGIVVARSDLEKTLKSFAKELGLNKKETTDLLKETERIKSNYQYVSFFNHETSHKILPLYFTPKPDNYRNIVFYIEEFSKKPSLQLKKPVFDPILRKGLTAIEVSIFIR